MQENTKKKFLRIRKNIFTDFELINLFHIIVDYHQLKYLFTKVNQIVILQ